MEGNDIIGKEVEGYKILKYLGKVYFYIRSRQIFGCV
jgi:hypothetical protein